MTLNFLQSRIFLFSMHNTILKTLRLILNFLYFYITVFRIVILTYSVLTIVYDIINSIICDIVCYCFGKNKSR